MGTDARPTIGFTCAYTPLPLIDAAGCIPFRVLPMGSAPDRAGQLLHDNLCPHVKRILDRALGGDLPDLGGMVFVNSCDAMRRATDAWQTARPEDPVFLLDLPVTADGAATAFFAHELRRLAGWLGRIGTVGDPESVLDASIERYNRLCLALDRQRDHLRRNRAAGTMTALQAVYNQASTRGLDRSLDMLASAPPDAGTDDRPADGVPLFLFGNVLPEPEIFGLLADCGADIVGEDVCTGSRLFQPIADGVPSGASPIDRLAAGLLSRPPCARTFSASHPGRIAGDMIAAARECNALGVIGHTLKFCDPYLARLPMIREAFRAEGMPLLLLEGDCSRSAMEQQRTRIEAFIEMLR